MSKSDKEKKYKECLKQMIPIRDALDVINGKWKVMIIVSIMHGNKRFKEIERSVPKITSKVLAKELKDLEQHQLIKRTIIEGYPVSIEYTPTTYSMSLEKVMTELHLWGTTHRKKMFDK